MSTVGGLHLACQGVRQLRHCWQPHTGGTSYPGPRGTGAREDESTQAKFFCNQSQKYECTW